MSKQPKKVDQIITSNNFDASPKLVKEKKELLVLSVDAHTSLPNVASIN